MNGRVTVRLARPDADAPGILSLYRPYIEQTAITFERDVPMREEFTARVRSIAEAFPYLLLEIDGELAGYAYAHRQAERAAFDWNAELSIYLSEAWVHRGLGGPLYALLMRLLAMQGYINFYAVITGSNAGSIAMHERMGFARIGLHERTGYKLGQWHDVVWMHRRVGGDVPGRLVPVGALSSEAVEREIKETEAEIEEKLRICQAKTLDRWSDL